MSYLEYKNRADLRKEMAALRKQAKTITSTAQNPHSFNAICDEPEATKEFYERRWRSVPRREAIWPPSKDFGIWPALEELLDLPHHPDMVSLTYDGFFTVTFNDTDGKRYAAKEKTLQPIAYTKLTDENNCADFNTWTPILERGKNGFIIDFTQPDFFETVANKLTEKRLKEATEGKNIGAAQQEELRRRITTEVEATVWSGLEEPSQVRELGGHTKIRQRKP